MPWSYDDDDDYRYNNDELDKGGWGWMLDLSCIERIRVREGEGNLLKLNFV